MNSLSERMIDCDDNTITISGSNLLSGFAQSSSILQIFIPIANMPSSLASSDITFTINSGYFAGNGGVVDYNSQSVTVTKFFNGLRITITDDSAPFSSDYAYCAFITATITFA